MTDPARAGGQDWLAMTRDRFDTDAEPVQLTLEGMPPAPDGCGTGDLLELLEPA